jgi:predicted pyridoxine 5'-phosphate oxidase superfamily flavin-nucleotide-binding protein
MDSKNGVLNADVLRSIESSVLCWLATVDQEGMPNVSPKEIFTHFQDDIVLIAHLASPVSLANIQSNPQVCVSFVDVFVQKGYKLKGTARVIDRGAADFDVKLKALTDLFSGKFPISAVIEIKVLQVSTIQAPSYFLFPDITEASQIESAMRTYGVKPL